MLVCVCVWFVVCLCVCVFGGVCVCVWEYVCVSGGVSVGGGVVKGLLHKGWLLSRFAALSIKESMVNDIFSDQGST